jgi:hypothetical protein
MTTVVAGSTAVLAVEWRQYAGGPLVAVTGVTITITALPATNVLGPTSTGVTNPSTGINTYSWAANLGLVPGPYLVTWAGLDALADVVTAAELIDVVAAGSGVPDLDDVKVYLKIDIGDTSQDVDIADALEAEIGAQRDVCRIPVEFSPALRQALLRRVARNLALRGLPLAVLRGDGEAGDTVLPGRDPEVRRFEAPYRRLKMG